MVGLCYLLVREKEVARMGLRMREKKVVTEATKKRYKGARKREKGRILDEFVQLTGYTRCYASYVLRNLHRRRQGAPREGRRKRIYTDEVCSALTRIWYICDCICGKRLAPYLAEIVSVLERHGELLWVEEEVRAKVVRMSAATIDRMLKKEKAKFNLKGKARTKPGTLLKSQVPIRTFAEWDEKRPGFVEVDLVGHDGGDTRGDYAQTLDVTDVCTGWTETQAVKNKAQVWVFEALKEIRNRLPFPLLGIDSDNGSEFINHHLVRYCEREKLTFTKTRSYRKNDNCYVEQKNYSVVRRNVGYARYETERALKILNMLYASSNPYTNFFQPVMKLIEKTRSGSRVTKRYDRARTPYQRVLESPCVSEEEKEVLRELYLQLNPVALKREITRLQGKLMGEEVRAIHSRGQPSRGHRTDLVYNVTKKVLR
jgi:hypothetical protein